MRWLELMERAHFGRQGNILCQDTVYSPSKGSIHCLWRRVTIDMPDRKVGADTLASLEGSDIFTNSNNFAS